MQIVRASIGGEIVLLNPVPKSVERLRLALRLENPAYRSARIYKLPTDGIDEWLESIVECPDGSCKVPRGAMSIVRRELEKDGFELEIVEDLRTSGSSINVQPIKELWEHQQVALASVLKHIEGVVVAPCGSGKSRLGVAIAGQLARKTLVVVPTEDILEEWLKTIREHLHVEPGCIRDSGVTDGPIVVAMVITLGNMLARGLNISEFGVLIIDEAHAVPSNTYSKFIPYCKARYRIALTATPDREDRLEPMIEWACGPRIYEISTKRLVQLGRLMLPKLEIVESDFEFSYDGPVIRKTHALNKAIRQYAKRNNAIASIAVRDAQAGECVIVLSNDKQHCRLLAKAIWEKGIEPVVLFGGAGKANKRRRKETIQGARDGTVSVIVATSLFDQGVDVQRLSRLILALPQRAKGRTQQRGGRIMRLWPGKEPVIYDIVDPKVDMLVRRFEERRRVYRAMGIDI